MVMNLAGILIALIVAAGCGKDAASDTANELKQLKAEMCACKDLSCAEAVAARTRDLSDRYRASSPTTAQMKAIAPMFDDLSACRSRVTGMSAAEMEAADKAGEQVGELARLKDAMCACKDESCTDEVDGRLRELAATHGGTPSAGTKWAAAPIFEELQKCRFKVTGEAAPPDEAIVELKAITKEMCACPDKACAERVTEKMMKFGEKHKDTKATDEQMKAAAAVVEELTKCMSRAMGMGGEATGP